MLSDKGAGRKKQAVHGWGRVHYGQCRKCTLVFEVIERQNLEDQNFKASLCYTESLRQASAA